MLSGFTGEGSKTVLPAKSMAKISTRLVPNQDPAKVATQMRGIPRAACATLRALDTQPAVRRASSVVDRNSPGMQAAVPRNMHTVFGKAPVLVREGGSVPIVGLMRHPLKHRYSDAGICAAR
ncbi:cytosolic non-specific dipeptidase [Chloroflexota bacterium]|nr:cytosolic non-specific dipeptidase [Chloroflexota bacterium]